MHACTWTYAKEWLLNVTILCRLSFSRRFYTCEKRLAMNKAGEDMKRLLMLVDVDKVFHNTLLKDEERSRIFFGRGKIQQRRQRRWFTSWACSVLFYCCLFVFNGRPLWTYLSEAKFDDKTDRWLSCLWADSNGKEIISSPRQNLLVEHHYWLILNRIRIVHHGKSDSDANRNEEKDNGSSAFRGIWHQYLLSFVLHVRQAHPFVYLEKKSTFARSFVRSPSWCRWNSSVGQTIQEVGCRWKRFVECSRIYVDTRASTESIGSTSDWYLRYGWKRRNRFQRYVEGKRWTSENQTRVALEFIGGISQFSVKGDKESKLRCKSSLVTSVKALRKNLPLLFSCF